MRLTSIAMLLAAPTLLACSALSTDVGTSESAHTEGEPTFANHPWQWADETLDEFRKNATGGAPGWYEGPEFLPLDHPMTQRLQFWADRMDEALRAAHPEALRGTPKPQIIIRKMRDPNAWVSFIPVQWNVPMRLTDAEKDAGAAPAPVVPDADGGAPDDASAPAADSPVPEPRSASVMILRNTGRVMSASEFTPFDRPHDAQKLEGFLKFYNEGFAKCRLSLEGEEVVLNEDCKRSSDVSLDRAKHLGYFATSKHVTVTTGYLLGLLDEDRVVSTMAHELGHYYRSHATMPTDVVNYFYTLDGANQARKPGPDPRSLDQTLAVREKLRAERSWFMGPDFTAENKFMTERNLGFYTEEQEADELALELMAKIGIPGGVLIDKLLQLQKMFDTYTDSGLLKWAECAALRERGWRDEAGKPVSVPVGDLGDPHHSMCFRAFNVSRELAAHRYVTAERPTPPGDDWSRVLTRMAAEVDPPPPPPPVDAGSPADAGGPDDASSPADASGAQDAGAD